MGKIKKRANAGLEMLLALLMIQEQKKKKKGAPKRQKPKKNKKQDIEAKIKDDEIPDFEITVSYGDPLQQIKVMNHSKLFSYLKSEAKVIKYKDNVYGDRTASIEANDKTIDINKAYQIIRNKKSEDAVAGGASWTYKLDKDYESFQYWNLFNRAINIAFYDVVMCVYGNSTSTPSALQTTAGSH